MRVAYYDDLHTEFGFWQPQPVDARVIVLAGDVAVRPIDYAAVVQRVRDANPDAEILGILGNHEGYNNIFPDAIAEYRAAVASVDRAQLLTSDVVAIDGVRFLGTTLWTDLTGMERAAEYAMNDYSTIKFRDRAGNVRKLRAADTTRAHQAAVGWLTQQLAHRNNADTVVITHHAPTWLSRIHHADDYKPMYCAKLGALISGTQPAIWIHGHSHITNDYHIGATHIVSNPRGYVDVSSESNPLFNEHATITIGNNESE